MLGVFLVILLVLGVFKSFLTFQAYFDHFSDIGSIFIFLDIL